MRRPCYPLGHKAKRNAPKKKFKYLLILIDKPSLIFEKIKAILNYHPPTGVPSWNPSAAIVKKWLTEIFGSGLI